MLKLVIHIGHGKTGSSSIQKTLLQHTAELSKQGIKYLGLMLENASNPHRKAWQRNSGSDQYFDKTSSEEANAQLLEVLSEEISALQSEGFSCAIWSNEWLATRGRHVLPALSVLKSRGIDIEVQCYVRRHDEWAQSAYLQWGVKHKSYEGPLRDFESWLPVFGQRDFRFGPSLRSWNDVFGTRLRVFNYDNLGDVVEHFLTSNNISDLTVAQDNITPDSIFLAAQAVFNSRSRNRVYPTEFASISRILRKYDQNNTVLPELDKLTPTEDTLSKLVIDRKEDIDEVNSFLLRSSEPPLSFDEPIKQAPHPTPWEMDQFILKLVFSLAEEAAELKSQIVALKAQINAQKTDKAH
ncbi:MAG: hypothetical protein M9939_12285 [Mesorhizobium sp.]|nr:hypothetical protein [Mesorhizobium sp.]MCO5161911.1 hypothetical protein [Mesorhizobium sp.]